MKTSKLIILFLITAIVSSCGSKSNNSEVLKYTTDKTLGLARINLNSITDKISAEKLLKEKTDLKEEQTLLLQLASNPKESGLNVDNPVFIIVDPGKKMEYPDIKTMFSISDKTKFQEKMSTITKKTIKIDDKGLIYFDNKLVGSLKGDLAIITQDEYSGGYYDEDEFISKINEKYFEEFWARTGSEKESIKEQVNHSLTSEKDVSAWMNIQATSSYLSKGYIETLAINKLLVDAGINVNFNFDKGIIEFESTTFFNKDLKEVVEKYYSKNAINYDLLKYINTENAKGYTLGFFSLDLVHHIIKEAGLESSINNYLTMAETNLAEIASIFTGDFAAVNYNSTDTSSYYRSTETAVVIGINKDKKELIEKFINKYPYIGETYAFTDNEFVYSTNPMILEEFKNKTVAKNSNLKKVSGVNSYSWTTLDELNTSTDKVKIIDVVSESKEDAGNLSSKVIVTFDKKEENIIYYLLQL